MASAEQEIQTVEQVENTVVQDDATVAVKRYFTIPGRDPFDEIEWEIRDAFIPGKDKPAFEQKDVEFPKFWSQTATNIVAQKYFRGRMSSPEREKSVKQMIGRIVTTAGAWGREGGYFANEEEAETFEAELKAILVNQLAAFNSPVWFNVGFEEKPQCSACFILSIDDSMESILDWIRREGVIFRGGSGSGVNLSKLRSSKEQLSKGGYASGPVSFMRGADASAGTIKSGGKTRRAAKMVVLDVDHPDIEQFIWCKAHEEEKARVLEAAGYDMSLNSEDWASIQYQNANNSVRVTDAFMEAADAGADWNLTARTDGQVVETRDARDILRQMAEAAWKCADPGVQYDTTINQWHTLPNTSRINASNPCSEYMSIDDSACNLASINLMKFRREDGEFDVEAFEHAVDTMFLAQEIFVGYSSYPTPEIEANAKAYRQLGLGYANLGALLMARGLPYDSDEGRAYAAAITALMTGRAYRKSAEIAARMGPFAGHERNAAAMLGVMSKHRAAVGQHRAHRLGRRRSPVRVPARLGRRARSGRSPRLPERAGDRARANRDDQLHDGLRHDGRRARLLAGEVEEARRRWRDHDREQDRADGAREARVRAAGGRRDRRVRGRAEHDGGRAVREERALSGVRLRGRRARDPLHGSREDDGCRPAVHLGRDLEDGQPAGNGDGGRRRQVFADAWRLGVKAIAIYRDNCKVAQPLSGKDKDATQATPPVPLKQRKRLPEDRTEVGRKFQVGDYEGYLHVGLYDDGTPGDIFCDVAKVGTTLQGLVNSLMISVSLGLQYGVPLEVYVSKFAHMRFEPAGLTNDADIRTAKSIVDYIFRWMGKKFLTVDQQEEIGILSPEVRARLAQGYANGDAAPSAETAAAPADAAPPGQTALFNAWEDAVECSKCGGRMVRTGSCYTCRDCGTNTGCS